MKLIDAIRYTDKFRKKQYPNGNVTELKMKYIAKTKQLYIQASVISSSDNRIKYKTQLVFNSIWSAPVRSMKYNLHYIDSDGTHYWLEKPTANHNILTRCSCDDFRFVGMWYVADKRALLGPRIPYTRVPGSNRPPVNPLKIPVLCKHELALIKRLLRQRLMKPNPFVSQYLNRQRREK